jgi:hypothetical protein
VGELAGAKVELLEGFDIGLLLVGLAMGLDDGILVGIDVGP